MINKKNRKKLILYFVLLIIIIITLGILFSKIIVKDNFNEFKYAPKNIYTSDTKLDFEFIFNDKLVGYPFSDRLISEIKNAKKEILIAVYSVDSTEIVDELYKAADRGIKINIVFDFKKHTPHAKLFNKQHSNISIIEVGKPDDNQSSFMHNKFAIFDNKLLFTGSWNWTILQETIDPTYVFITRDADLIKSYTEEFARLYNDKYSRKKFLINEYNPFYTQKSFSDSTIEIWFSPGIETNSIQKRTIDLINSSKKSIKILIWQMTDQAIAQAILEKAEEGIEIKIITDDEYIESDESGFVFLNEKINEKELDNIIVISDEKRNEEVAKKYPQFSNLNSFLHHHMLIIDDEIAMIGTNNWSDKGAFDNDENIIICDDDRFIEELINSFDFNFNILNTTE